jgi:hypothetical protein
VRTAIDDEEALMSTQTASIPGTRSRALLSGAAVVLAIALAAMLVPTAADAAKVKVKGGKTSLALDPDVAALLDSAGIAPSPISPARVNANGSLGFPITGGRVNSKTLAGRIKHSGGIRLATDATGVDLARFTIDTRVPELTALVGGARVPILSLDLGGATVKVNKKGGNVRIRNVGANLTAVAAAALNDAFSTTAFVEGALIGTAKVKAKVG